MTRKTFTYITLIISIYCFIACKSQNDPAPPALTTIDKNLLKGWWATPLTNNSQTKIYFGDDNFFYQDTVKDAAPIAGFWRTSNNSIAYSEQLNSAAIRNFEVIKLTATEMELKIGASTSTFTKITQPAITSAPISTIAGTGTYGYTGDGGPALSAQISATAGIYIDKAGNIYFCDRGNLVVRKIAATDGKITTIAGTGNRNIVDPHYIDNSSAISVDLIDPVFLVGDAAGNIYFTESNFSGRISRITPDGKKCVGGCEISGNDFSGDGGLATKASFKLPQGIAFDTNGNIYIADLGNNKIRKISATDGKVNTIAGTGIDSYDGDGGLAANAKITTVDLSINTNGDIYFSDLSNHIRKITAATGIITTIAGTGISGSKGDGGPAISANIDLPFGIKVLANGDIYFTELANHTIRKIDGTTGIITRVAGTGYKGYTGDGIHASAYSLDSPYGITTDATGNLYVSEAARLRKIATN
jgi:sugar lactone lactonase YvrE